MIMNRAYCAGVLMAFAAGAFAQERTLTVLVGAPAGSPADAIARVVATRMKDATRMNVVVENKPAAGGRAAAMALRAAAADALTILIAPETLVCVYPQAGKEIGYNPFRDFVPVTQVATSPFVLAVSAAAPAKKVAEFLKWAGENPDKAEFGSPAEGSSPQFFGLALGESAGVKLRHVAYEDSAALQADLAGGKLVAAVDTLSNLAAPHRAGKVRILAVSGAKRSSLLPGVPTFAEEGLKDPGGEGWFGFFAPWDTPVASVDRLAGSLRTALGTPDAQAVLAKLGLQVTATSPYELRLVTRSDYAHWGAAAQAAGYVLLEIPKGRIP
jgi:tripartite-type tricarboxylate transporter receptor subunit TctC